MGTGGDAGDPAAWRRGADVGADGRVRASGRWGPGAASAGALSALWVSADMSRTFPDNVRFRKDAEPCLQGPLYNVLLAYGHHNHGVGYCQVSPGPPTDPGASPSRGSWWEREGAAADVSTGCVYQTW